MQGNMKRRALAAAGFLVFFTPLPGLFSQDAQIYFGTGKEFSINSAGKLRTVPVPGGGGNAGAVFLNRNDVVQTGPGVWLECQISPGGTVLKIAENTSFSYGGFDEPGRFIDINLLYGRLRAVSGEDTSGPRESRTRVLGYRTVVVRGGIAAVRIEESDVAVDFLITPPRAGTTAPRSQLTASVFRGEAVVEPFDPLKAVIDEEGIVAGADESIYVELASSMVFSERRALARETTFYWNSHNFEGDPPLALPQIALTKAEVGMVNEVGSLVSYPDPRTLSFAYTIKGKKIAWLPEKVYDDGKKTNIVFANKNVLAALTADEGDEGSAFQIVENKKDAVKYRVWENVIIIDKLITTITMQKGKESVTITQEKAKKK